MSQNSFSHKLNKSVLLTMLGIVLLFSTSIGVTLLAPRWVNAEWVHPSCEYQRQIYEVADPNVYISVATTGGRELQPVRHLKAGQTFSAFIEGPELSIVAKKELRPYITPFYDKTHHVRLTSRLLLLREPAEAPASSKKQVLELYDPQLEAAFAISDSDGMVENWADPEECVFIENTNTTPSGVLFVKNPIEYRISPFLLPEGGQGWRYDPRGRAVKDLEELRNKQLGFMSRQELISLGEHIYAIEGCWYCHTDQTRTLIQDAVLNGMDYPAPPSTPNEYIYQEVTFPGTRRIGPDMSRVGVKRPSRDWHRSHFFSPKTESPGSIMPSFKHFFDDTPTGSARNTMGIPNYKFEAVYQYLMTKGTRLTPPNQAWWLGKDPVRTLDIIEGRHFKGERK